MAIIEKTDRRGKRSAPAMPVIGIAKVSVNYGSYAAVSGCSFEISEGDVFGFLGPNGAGKSSLIRAISGTVYYEGTISLLGKNISEMDRETTNSFMGVVPQDPFVYKDFTVIENLLTAGKMYGLSGDQLDKRVEELLAQFMLKKFRDRKAMHLSGGYRRLLSIAMSVMHKPKFLMMDEPTVGLDPDIREKIWDIIQGLRQSGTTVLLTTHYLDEAEALCGKVAIIDRGKILASGSTHDLIDMYGGYTTITVNVDKDASALEERMGRIKDVVSAKVSGTGGTEIRLECENKYAVRVIRDLILLIGSPPHEISPLDSLVREPTLGDAFKKIVEKEAGL
jgi:ABC-2 type transport system ATP-binding protein